MLQDFPFFVELFLNKTRLTKPRTVQELLSVSNIYIWKHKHSCLLIYNVYPKAAKRRLMALKFYEETQLTE